MDNREHRRNRRVRARFHMKLAGVERGDRPFVEVVRTQNISKTGSCFQSGRWLNVGDEVCLSIPLPARVVRVEPTNRPGVFRYAVAFKPYTPPGGEPPTAETLPPTSHHTEEP